MTQQEAKNLLAVLWAHWAPRVMLVAVTLAGCQRPRDMEVQEQSDAEVLQETAAALNEFCHPDGPVGIQVVPDGGTLDWWGMTQAAGSGWLIQLSSDLHGHDLRTTLEHEWAHTLAWNLIAHDSPASVHGAQWGIEFSRAYRAVQYRIQTPDIRLSPENR
jgi:hypothetical protein